MKGQLNLFADLPPPSTDKPMLFKPAQRPIWTENKAKLIERYLFYFVLVTKHARSIRARMMLGLPSWYLSQSQHSSATSGFARSAEMELRSWRR
jgi:hypothetical protein